MLLHHQHNTSDRNTGPKSWNMVSLATNAYIKGGKSDESGLEKNFEIGQKNS